MAANDPENRNKITGDARAAAVAWMLPFDLVVPMVVLGGAGFLLDRWLHTNHILMLVLGFIGLAIGLRAAIKTASMLDKK